MSENNEIDPIDVCGEPATVPDWQKEELARRKENLLRHPESALTWKELIAKLRDATR